ncbi:hypothetical protein G6F35_016056 [Rhizopus arrhizus]|nr:hypothetical protein G6F35_016056 [Rhizopus arrhizus]
MVPQSYCRRSGTTTCKPLPPLVFNQGVRPISSSRVRTSWAACCTAGQPTPSPGSRSNSMRSGLPIAVFTAFQVWNSTTFICTADSTASAVGTSSSGGWPGSSLGGNDLTPGMAASRCFWKNSSPWMPAGARRNETGREFRCSSSRGATRP